ncbi:MAG: helix-turn-helix domain-containing protein [Deltaproteobacteria bacterium]|nr:helix-turn-helix domain-containing protein [Deltaproteobacteria bacterium]
MIRELWMVEDVARWLRIAPKTVYNKVERGEIPYRKIGGALRFIPEEIENWFRKNGKSN